MACGMFVGTGMKKTEIMTTTRACSRSEAGFHKARLSIHRPRVQGFQCRSRVAGRCVLTTVASVTPNTEFVCPAKLNTTPHARDSRQMFYQDASEAVVAAVESPTISRCSMVLQIPETNIEGDVYRVGTLLELARNMATGVIRSQKKKCVKLCVQQSLGEGIFTGLPLSLSGVRRLLEMLDFEDDVADYVKVGAVSEEEVDDECAAYIVLCPQNIVNGCVVPLLEEMTLAAEAKGQTVMILNANLGDVPSSGGRMQVGGRKERIAFAKSFTPIYHFRLLYQKPFFYPIYGCIRMTVGERWGVFKKIGGTNVIRDPESYVLVDEFDKEPTPQLITGSLMRKRE